MDVTQSRSFWPVVGLGLVAGHIVMAFGICSLIHWLYFDAGVQWTRDAVVPQMQGVAALVGQTISALIFVPAGLLARKHNRHGLLVALAWPLLFAITPLFIPAPIAWIVLSVFGIRLLRKPRIDASA